MNRSGRVVVLGGTGFVGRHLVPRLAAAGYTVTVLSRHRDRHRELWPLPGVEVRNANVYDAGVLEQQLRGAVAAINLVGILNERGRNGAGFQRAHVELTRTLLAAMGRAGVSRLLQMSALRAGQGRSHYLRTRGEAEALVKASSAAWTIFQPSVIFGDGDGLYCRFAGLLRLMPVLPLARSRTRFAPVYVGDVVAAFVQALGDDATVGRSFELGGPDTLTLRGIVVQTRDWLRLRRLVIGLPEPLGRLQALAMDFVPGKPFSSDNWKSLALDSIPETDGFAALGIKPTPAAHVMPRVLGHTAGKQDDLDAFRAAR